MQMHDSEYKAILATLSESRQLAEELNITLTELLLLRQVVYSSWLCDSKVNEGSPEQEPKGH